MTDQANLVSKVLVLDSDADCLERIRIFCESNNLMGLKGHDDNVLAVLKKYERFRM